MCDTAVDSVSYRNEATVSGPHGVTCPPSAREGGLSSTAQPNASAVDTAPPGEA